VATLGQRRKQLIDSRQAPRSRPAELTADHQVLFDRERREKPAPFGNKRNAAGDHRMRGLITNRLAVEQDGIATRRDHASDTSEQRGFAGAVGADHRDHLARRHA
jgi:hypothetical protein